MLKDKTNVYILSVVGIVALVGIVMLVIGEGKTSTTGVSGQVIVPLTSRCSDTDGSFISGDHETWLSTHGDDGIYVKGSATGYSTYYGVRKTYTDSCQSTNELYESWCISTNQVTQRTVHCGDFGDYKCSDGACVPK